MSTQLETTVTSALYCAKCRRSLGPPATRSDCYTVGDEGACGSCVRGAARHLSYQKIAPEKRSEAVRKALGFRKQPDQGAQLFVGIRND